MPDHLSDGEIVHIQKYLSYLIDVFSLGTNFQFMIMDEDVESHKGEQDEPPDATVAAVITHEYRNAASLYINKSWREFPIRVRTNTLVHEVLHVVHKPLDIIFKDYVDGPDLTFRTQAQADNQFTRAAERMVDQLAYAIAPLLEGYPIDDQEIYPNVVTEGNNQ